MHRAFTHAEAQALMPEVRRRAADLVVVRADFAEAADAAHTRRGGIPELKALEARFHEALEWFPRQGIQVKRIAPLLVDFPAVAEGEDVLLCWLEGEPALEWYHPARLGFMGRRRIAASDRP
ncbi:DUF2203 domain-containing protein [soil metagenome]